MIEVTYFNDSFTNKARCCWPIKNFGRNLDVKSMSKLFLLNTQNISLKWCLYILPINQNHEDYVSIYLKLLTDNAPEIEVSFEFSILNAKHVITNTKKSRKMYGKIKSYGCEKFIKRDFLLNKANNLLVGDVLTISCDIEFTYINATFKLAQDFENMLSNQKYCDAEFDVSGHKIRAHKNILAARSNVFAAMFEQEMKEAKTYCAVISDIDHETFKEMLYFIYTGEVIDLNEVCFDLIAAADKYELNDLKVLCEDAISEQFSTEIAAETLIVADRHSCQHLKKQTIDFINSHAIDVIKTQGWRNMIEKHTHLIAEVFESLVTQQATGAEILTQQESSGPEEVSDLEEDY